MAMSVITPAVKDGPGPDEERIAPEILAVIAAAATAMLGTNLRISSVELMRASSDSVSRWTRQGRANVQASHNLRTKR
jgi:hypothetical protein